MNRRRMITILAGSSAATGFGASQFRKQKEPWRWKGVLFNTEVELSLHDLAGREAEELAADCVAEMQRLEQLFSLYRPDSTLCELNRHGAVEGCAPEFVALVREALEVAEASKGAFDPTVQPYWVWLRNEVESPGGIDESERLRVLGLVDYRNVSMEEDAVRFQRPGMGMTLNGIAQGWITDRIAERLREAGLGHCLVNLGEYAAIGPERPGQDWRVAIRGTDAAPVVDLRDGALAVSSGSGLYFGTGSQWNHLIDPSTGRSAGDRRVVAVTAPRASLADALSTACAVMEAGEAQSLVSRFPGSALRVFDPIS